MITRRSLFGTIGAATVAVLLPRQTNAQRPGLIPIAPAISRKWRLEGINEMNQFVFYIEPDIELEHFQEIADLLHLRFGVNIHEMTSGFHARRRYLFLYHSYWGAGFDANCVPFRVTNTYDLLDRKRQWLGSFLIITPSTRSGSHAFTEYWQKHGLDIVKGASL